MAETSRYPVFGWGHQVKISDLKNPGKWTDFGLFFGTVKNVHFSWIPPLLCHPLSPYLCFPHCPHAWSWNPPLGMLKGPSALHCPLWTMEKSAFVYFQIFAASSFILCCLPCWEWPFEDFGTPKCGQGIGQLKKLLAHTNLGMTWLHPSPKCHDLLVKWMGLKWA